MYRFFLREDSIQSIGIFLVCFVEGFFHKVGLRSMYWDFELPCELTTKERFSFAEVSEIVLIFQRGFELVDYGVC